MPEFKNLSPSDASEIYSYYWLKAFLHWGQWCAFGAFCFWICIWHYIAVPSIINLLGHQLSGGLDILILAIFSLAGYISYQIILNEAIRQLMRSK